MDFLDLVIEFDFVVDQFDLSACSFFPRSNTGVVCLEYSLEVSVARRCPELKFQFYFSATSRAKTKERRNARECLEIESPLDFDGVRRLTRKMIILVRQP